MTNLEFIEKEIKYTKNVIEATQEALNDNTNMELKLYRNFNEEALLEKLNNEQKRLQTLQQIKSELEAWEVVKPSIHHIKEQKCFVIHNIFRNNQYNFIKKAVEVNKNVD